MTRTNPRRTPVLVGSGQVLQRNPAESDAIGPNLVEPLVLMERAARLAAEDAGCPALLSQLDSIRVPRGLWPYANPAHILGVRLGSPGAHTMTAPVSGNMVQRMLTHGAREIAAGDRDIVMVVGAEAGQTKRRLKRAGRKPGWSAPDAPPPDLDLSHLVVGYLVADGFDARGLGGPGEGIAFGDPGEAVPQACNPVAILIEAFTRFRASRVFVQREDRRRVADAGMELILRHPLVGLASTPPRTAWRLR